MASHGASPWTLPEGAWSLYGGAGVGTFDIGMSGATRDRQLQTYANVWFGVGVSERVEVDASWSLSHHRVLEDPTQGPCPTVDDYCAATTGPGLLKAGIKRRLSGGSLPVALRLGAALDPWNRGQRHRWTNLGQGIVAGEVDLLGEVGGDAGEHRFSGVVITGAQLPWPRRATSASGEQRWVIAPALRASVEAAWQRGPVRASAGLLAHQRVNGLPFGAEWVNDWRTSDDRWGVTRWGELRPELKLSVEPTEGWGIHLAASRPIWVQAGPPNLWNASVGVHRYRPRKRKKGEEAGDGDG